MKFHRPLALGIAACSLTAAGMAAAHQLAHAAQSPIVVSRFLLGQLDKRGRFIATAGRGATNVPRNALAMFAFSGAVDSGPNLRATLPLTLAEQAELQARIEQDPDYDPSRDGYEPGVVPRKRSDDRAAFLVATGSVSPFTMLVGTLTGTSLENSNGQFFKYIRPGTSQPAPARVLFNPRYQIATYNHPGEIDYNPEALEPNTTYTVFIDGGPNPANSFDLVRNRDGLPLGAPFFTQFTTGSRYVQDFSRPELRTNVPGDGSTNVPYDADIEITFDEPMDVSSFVLPRFQGDDVYTIIVRYTPNPINGTLRGRNVVGIVRVKPQTGGNVVQFRPIQGFGKGPYEVEVVVTNLVTDLSGNNINRQFQFTFRTESNPTAEDFSQFDESFDNLNKRDGSYVPVGDYLAAKWNGNIAPPTLPPAAERGILSTSVQEVAFDVAGPNAPTNLGPSAGVNVWYHQPIEVQMLFPAAEMGGRARTLSGFYWLTGTLRGRTYPGFAVQLGHANEAVDAAGFPSSGPSSNHFGDFPVVVIPTTTYRTATTTVVQNTYVKSPEFQSVFDYDGQRGLILHMVHNGDPASTPQPAPNNDLWERWRNDNSYLVNCSTVRIPSVNVSQTNGWLYSIRFNYLTPGAEAQSLFYDIGRPDARILPQQVVPGTQPQGTSAIFLWQGAKEDSINPTVPDLTTLTGWLSDIRSLSNYRFIRFHCTLRNNTHARTSPKIDLLSIPFVWK